MDRQQDPQATTRSGGAFPGGKVRLPRLNETRSSGPVIDMVDTAFLGGGTATATEPEQRSGFTGYFTYESLFEDPGDDTTVDPDDPYTVLKVDRAADWPTIVAAHRALVKAFHPDRFVGHPPEVITQAETEIKRINGAYAELRKHQAEIERQAPSHDAAPSASRDRRTGNDRRQTPR